jgi:Capsule assembly protein Wzi
MRIKIIRLVCVFIFLLNADLHAQAINESLYNNVYNFLDQISLQRECSWLDIVKPVTRNEIKSSLNKLLRIKDSLSIRDRDELLFHANDFQLSEDLNKSHYKKFTLDQRYRFRALTHKDGANTIYADPIVGSSLGLNNGKIILERNMGINFWGNLSEKFSYSFYFNDINYDGDGIKEILSWNGNRKFVNIGDKNVSNKKNYNDLRVSLTYSFKNGFISTGQDRLSFGYGYNSNIILSQNAPAYPFIRLKYLPFKKIQFNYLHSFLQSNIIDKNTQYSFNTPTYGGVSNVYIPKFYAMHSLSYAPKEGIDLSLGESIVYANKLNIGYLFPLNYFKSFDNTSSNQNLLAGANGQFFAAASVRRFIPKTQLYAQLFIDEIRISKLLTNENRNQVGYQVGAKTNDLFKIKRLIGGLEYTRNRPFVYSNLNPVQYYTHHDEMLGDWLGNNSDRMLAFFQYYPNQRIQTKLELAYIRKGGPGTIEQQYLASPQPDFFFDPQFKQKSITFEAKYQVLNQLFVILRAQSSSRVSVPDNQTKKFNTISAGFYYGL